MPNRNTFYKLIDALSVTENANRRPSTAAVTVQVVLQRRNPYRLVSRKRAPTRGPAPVSHGHDVVSGLRSPIRLTSLTRP